MFQAKRPLSSDADCTQALIANAAPVPDEAGATCVAEEPRVLIDTIARAANPIRELGGAVQDKLQTEAVSSLSTPLHLAETEGRQAPAAGFGNDRDTPCTGRVSLSAQSDDIVCALDGHVLLTGRRSNGAADRGLSLGCDTPR